MKDGSAMRGVGQIEQDEMSKYVRGEVSSPIVSMFWSYSVAVYW